MGAKKLDFNELYKFVTREAFGAEKNVSRILEIMPEESIVTGDVVGPLKLMAYDNEAYLLRAEESYFCRFRAGDTVSIALIDKRTKKFKAVKDIKIGLVRFPALGVVEVFCNGLAVLPDDKAEYFLVPKSYSQVIWNLRKRLQAVEDSKLKAEYRKLDLKAAKTHISEFGEKLNPVQKEALEFLVDNDFKGLVQGPPGTGKTHLLVDLVKLALKSGLKVGLASLTHTAVDNALARVIDSGVSVDNVVRVAGDSLKVKADVYGDIDIDEVWGGSFKKIEAKSGYDDPVDYSLYAATLHSWCLSKKTPDIDVLIIDEASQVPLYFQSFLESISARLIMFGDHKQLPPVIQVTDHQLPAEDIFSYEIANNQYPMLETQYRMNEVVQGWSSNRFYDGKLQPHESNRNRDVLKGAQYEYELFGLREVNILKHKGVSKNNSNTFEASKVAELVSNIHLKGGVPLDEIGIVTPHRVQAGCINASLQDKFGLEDSLNILVDTVERFQGQEKEAMVFSMGVDQDSSKKGDRGFLGDGRRLNVAVTRAKSRFYCMASTKLIETTQKQANAENLKSFFEWCDPRKKGDT